MQHVAVAQRASPCRFTFACWLSNAFTKRTKIIVTAVCTPLVLLSFFQSDGPSSSSYPSAPPASSVGSRPASEAAPSKGKNRLAQRERFRLGEFSYTIGSSRVAYELGGQFAQTFPARGAVFLVVNYRIENESNKTKTVMSDDFVIRDGKGREYRPSSKANTALLMQSENKDFLLSELQPGIAHQTATAFEIPMTSLDADLTLIVPEKGFRSGKVEVALRPQ